MGATTVAIPTVAQVNKPHRTYFGDRAVQFFMVTMSNSYATGGDTVVFPAPKSVDFADFEDVNVDATHVYRATYDRINAKIKVINLIGGVEVVNAFDLSAISFRTMLTGK